MHGGHKNVHYQLNNRIRLSKDFKKCSQNLINYKKKQRDFQRDSGHIVFADIFTFLKETGILKRNVFGGTIDSVLYSNLKGGGIAPRSYLPTAKKTGEEEEEFRYLPTNKY